MTLAIWPLEPSVGGERGHDEADHDEQLWVDGVRCTSVRLLGLRLRRLTFPGAERGEKWKVMMTPRTALTRQMSLDSITALGERNSKMSSCRSLSSSTSLRRLPPYGVTGCLGHRSS